MIKNLIFAVVLMVATTTVFGQKTTKDVQVTRNPNDVKGLVKVCDINESAQKLFGSQGKLREKAIEKAKVTAFEKGATIILIEVDNFAMTPINNVNIIATGYTDKK